MWAAQQAKGKGKGKGAFTATAIKQPAPRQRVTQHRVTGSLASWKGKFGFITPDQPIDHPLARNHKGQIYLSQEDVQKDIDGIGQTLSFFVYADSSGLGAMQVIPGKTNTKPVQKVIAKTTKVADKKPAKGKGKGAPQGEDGEKKEAGQAPDKANRNVLSGSPVQGTIVDWRGQVGWIKPDDEVEELGGPERKKHKGLLYVHATDVDGEMPLINAQVVYFMYSDEMGLGAEMCQVIAQGDGERKEAGEKGKAKTKTVPVQKKVDKKGKAMPKKSVQRPKGGAEKKGLSGPDLPRERIMDIALTGEVTAWKGKFGWIEPSEPIEHEQASKHDGKVYVNVKDLVGADALEKGATVQFQVFVDASGLGAEEVLVL